MGGGGGDALHKHVTEQAAEAKAAHANDGPGPGPTSPAQRFAAADLLTQRYMAADATYVHHDVPPVYDPNRPDMHMTGPTARVQGEAFVRGANDANAVDPNDVRQGAIGDCWLMSALIAVARANPRAIESLIKTLGNGRYEVTLYIGEETVVGKHVSRAPVKIIVNDVFPMDEKSPKATRYADPGDRGGNGPELWVMLIEKAYAKHMGKYDGQAYLGGGLTARFESAIEDLLPEGQMIGIPLSTSVVKEAFGGVADNLQRNAATETFTQHPAMLIKYLQGCLDQHRPVTAMTKVDVTFTESALATKWGVPNWHHYALKSVNEADNTIYLQNPWGSDDVKNIPVAEFLKLYAHLQVGPSLTGPVDAPIKKSGGDQGPNVT